jgi:ribosomal-protein-alanine N-acetyltransferase
MNALFRVRRAEIPHDLSAVEQLQNETFTNPWSADAIRWELENTDVARLYVMDEAAGPVVAFCACWIIFDEVHLNSLAVAQHRRRQGLATLLIGHVLGEARASGVTAATLEVRSSNLPARQLYEGLGFAIEGVRRDYYQNPREDALILWNRRL